ncbi:MAG TPA: polyprenyl synthetase family protein [Firmicutes bacterium]|nr:polyprenyl synthetase family protein [Bacillota bacterium]
MVSDLQAVYRPAEAELTAVNEEMCRAVNTLTPFFQEAALSFIQAGGKRLRPLLTILAAKLGQMKTPQVVQVAAALELVHLGSLVHDDVIDESLWRRGKPSVNAAYGNRVAVLLGDFYFARSLDLARQVGVDAVKVISDVISSLVEGELEQLQRSYDISITEQEYWDRVRRKTASFIAECCRLGALYSPGNPVDPEELHAYGMNLGLAYQVVDDLLDFTSDKQTIGKPTNHDLRDGIITLPVIHALRVHPRREELAALIKSRRDFDLNMVLQCMHEAGSLAFAEQRVAELIAHAKTSLKGAPEHEAKAALLAIADFVLTRVS